MDEEMLAVRVPEGFIGYPDGTLMKSLDGGPVEVALSGGGFSGTERAAIVADLAAGRIKVHDVPPGDGSKICISFVGAPRPEDVPVWQASPHGAP